jgi:hypothetical protein
MTLQDTINDLNKENSKLLNLNNDSDKKIIMLKNDAKNKHDVSCIEKQATNDAYENKIKELINGK